VSRASKISEPFSLIIELDSIYTSSQRSAYSVLWMLANIGGLCFIVTFLVRWLLHACARPLHVARLIEKMYKRTSSERGSLPAKVIQEDEATESRPTSRTESKAEHGEETYFEKMNRKRQRLWNELQVRGKISFSTWDVIKASFV